MKESYFSCGNITINALKYVYIYIYFLHTQLSHQFSFTGYWLNDTLVQVFMYIQRHVSATQDHHQIYMMIHVSYYTVL
jgi:hypothetical protein